MDRFDERKSDNDRDRTDRADTVESPRQGDALGLSGAAIPKAPADLTTEYDSQSVARRRERAAEENEPSASESTETRRGPGATGNDMGSEGTRTDVTGR